MEEDNTVNNQIDKCVELLKHIFGNNLLGVYLYGSIINGGLQKFSDIDIFVITNKPTINEERAELVNALLKISGIYAVSKDQKPIELTIVVKSDINPWGYPPKFDFMYGDWMRKDFENGNFEPWKTNINPTLAIVITQLLLSNKTLFGKIPSQLLNPVPYKDFIKALTAEIDSLMNNIDWDTRNVLLTLTRIWCTLETDSIRSKTNAVSWSIEKLPNEIKPPLERAKTILLGERDDEWNDIKDEIKPCANYIIDQIKIKTNEINTSDLSSKSIIIV